jgi:hypothetical protein
MRVAFSGLFLAGSILTASSATVAAPISPRVIQQAAEQIAVAETVHCRPYRHWHRWGYGRGCGGGVVFYGPRVRSGYSARYREYYDGGFRYARPSVPRFQQGQAYLGYRGARPQSKWEAKGFCPPGQAKKGNC